MARISHMDEITDYKALIINKIKSSQAVMGLIANNPEINLNSDEAIRWEDQIYDYAFIEDTFQEDGAYIMVEVDMIGTSKSMKHLEIYIQIVCSKNYMSLKEFKGVKGNRKDNIARQIDLLLHNSRDFGMGRLYPTINRDAPVPDKYTSRLLVYYTPDFAYNEELLEDE